MNSPWDGFVCEEYEPNKVDEKPTTVPSLEIIAAVKVAIALWHRAKDAEEEEYREDHDEWANSLFDIVFRQIDALPIPKLNSKFIKKIFRRVDYNIYEWGWHLARAVSLEIRPENVLSKSYQLVDCIMWHPNGRINLVKTARNVLKSDVGLLNNIQKFHLASVYCLQEEIEKIWPKLEEIDRKFIDEHAGSPSFYWANFCKNVWNTLQNQSSVSIEELRNLQDRVYLYRNIHDRTVMNWSAVEYFFDRLNTEQQVKASVYFISEFGLRFQTLALRKLSKSQRVSVLEKCIISIIRNYAKFEDDEEDAIATWYEFRNLITPDQFVELMSELLFNGIKDWILTEIWNSARDDCKHRVLNYENFIEIIFSEWFTEYDEKTISLTFVSTVLLYLYRAGVDIKEEITKKSFFIYSCLQLCCSNLQLLDRLLNLCRLDAAASTNYKQSLFRSPNFNVHFKTLVTKYPLQMLVELLDFGLSITDPSSAQFQREMLFESMKLLNGWCLAYYSDGNLERLNVILAPLRTRYPEIVSEFKRNLLLSDRGLQTCVNNFVSENCILPEIIADGLPTDLAAEFKRKIISSPEAIDKLKSMMVNEQSNAAMKLIDWFLESKRARQKFKKQLMMV